MSNPREPLPDAELEELVRRSAQLLERGKADAEVVMRALVLSVQKTLAERAPQQAPNMVDQILQQQYQQPGTGPFAGPPQEPPPFYGAPGRSRPAGIPDPGQFGPQQF